MIKSITQFEVKIGEKLFQLICHPEATWGEVHDAVFQIKDFVIQKIVETHNAEKSQQTQMKGDCQNCENPPCDAEKCKTEN